MMFGVSYMLLQFRFPGVAVRFADVLLRVFASFLDQGLDGLLFY
jgi:hypothetical protein